MTRRNFLSSIFAGAAALVGVKMLPKEEPKITFGPNAKVNVTETPSKKYTVEDAVRANNAAWANKPCTVGPLTMVTLEDAVMEMRKASHG